MNARGTERLTQQMVNYARWEALDSSDDEQTSAKPVHTLAPTIAPLRKRMQIVVDIVSDPN